MKRKTRDENESKKDTVVASLSWTLKLIQLSIALIF